MYVISACKSSQVMVCIILRGVKSGGVSFIRVISAAWSESPPSPRSHDQACVSSAAGPRTKLRSGMVGRELLLRKWVHVAAMFNNSN